MNRRELLQAVAVGVATPHSAVAQAQEDSEDIEDRYLTAVLDSYAEESGRVIKSYEIQHRGQTRIQWILETVNSDTLFSTEYPLSRITEEYHGDYVVLTYYTEPPDRRPRSRTYIDVWSDYVYHKHLDTQSTVTYKEHIDTGDYERVA